MKILIIEDERPAARRLTRMLEKQELQVETAVHSVKESVEYLLSHPSPDLIFLDIQLSDGLSFEIFEHVQVDSFIIFTTAYDEYALKAFKLNSIDYLLKPIDGEELEQAVDKFKKLFNKENYKKDHATTINPADLQQIAALLQTSTITYKTRYTAKVGEHIKLFTSDEIQLFYSENKGTYINLPNGRNYLIDSKLELVDTELDPNKFFRISRQAIICIDAITDIIAYTNSRLKIKIESFKEFDLIVSREKVKNFKNWLEG